MDGPDDGVRQRSFWRDQAKESPETGRRDVAAAKDCR